MLHHSADQLHGTAKAEIAAVNAEVIALHGAPFLGGIVFIIGRTALVGLDDQRPGLFRRDILPLGHPLNPNIHGSVDEDAQMIGIIRQCVVRATTDNDAGTLLGDVADRIKGSQIHLLLQGIAGTRARQAEHVGVHGNGIEQALGPLIKIFKNLLAQTAFLRCRTQQLFIVERDTQLLGYADTDFLAAAAELPSDGNDGLHGDPSSLCCIYYTAK